MKRIEVTGPVTVNLAGTAGGVERFVFLPRQSYDVPDAVADFPYLAQYLSKCEEVETPKPKARKGAKGNSHGKTESVVGGLPSEVP